MTRLRRLAVDTRTAVFGARLLWGAYRAHFKRR